MVVCQVSLSIGLEWPQSVAWPNQLLNPRRKRRCVANRKCATARSDRFRKTSYVASYRNTATGNGFNGDKPKRFMANGRHDHQPVPIEQLRQGGPDELPRKAHAVGGRDSAGELFKARFFRTLAHKSGGDRHSGLVQNGQGLEQNMGSLLRNKAPDENDVTIAGPFLVKAKDLRVVRIGQNVFNMPGQLRCERPADSGVPGLCGKPGAQTSPGACLTGGRPHMVNHQRWTPESQDWPAQAKGLALENDCVGRSILLEQSHRPGTPCDHELIRCRLLTRLPRND